MDDRAWPGAAIARLPTSAGSRHRSRRSRRERVLRRGTRIQRDQSVRAAAIAAAAARSVARVESSAIWASIGMRSGYFSRKAVIAASFGVPSWLLMANTSASTVPSLARSEMARNTDHGIPRCSHALRDRGRLHVERHDPLRPQLGELVEVGGEGVGRPHPALVLGVADAGRPVLAAAGAEHDDLGTDERPDRGLVLERAGDADHEHVVHVDRVEEPLDAGGGELGAHAGDDRHDLAAVERSAMHGHTVDVGLGQLELAAPAV